MILVTGSISDTEMDNEWLLGGLKLAEIMSLASGSEIFQHLHIIAVLFNQTVSADTTSFWEFSSTNTSLPQSTILQKRFLLSDV